MKTPDDTVPALLSPGEFWVEEKVTLPPADVCDCERLTGYIHLPRRRFPTVQADQGSVRTIQNLSRIRHHHSRSGVIQMSVLAVASAYFVNSDPVNSGKFMINISIAGIVSGNRVDESIQLNDIDPSISSITLEAAIETLVKNELTTNHGYTFGLFDSVRLLGALL